MSVYMPVCLCVSVCPEPLRHVHKAYVHFFSLRVSLCVFLCICVGLCVQAFSGRYIELMDTFSV